MKPALVKFVPLLLFLFFPLLVINQTVYAHCHTLNDSTGDSGSSFGFTDIVSTELSNQGESIGVRITTAGNIPNSFGTTGQMVFGVMFPASLLSGDPNDTGINFITVHWKEDGTGWEGSEFIFRETLESKPWNATISLNGPTATFSIPKELIGKGELAYLVSIGLVSEDGESNDYAPNNFFSDCIAPTLITPSTQPQTITSGTSESISSSPKTVTEAPTKEGNKFIERPGVKRLNNIEVGKSLVEQPFQSLSPVVSKSLKTIQDQNLAVSTSKPPGLLAGLALIALVGITITAITRYAFLEQGNQKNDEEKKKKDPCEELRKQLKQAEEELREREDRQKEHDKDVKNAEEALKKATSSKDKEEAQEKLDKEKEAQKGSADLYKEKKAKVERFRQRLNECEKKAGTYKTPSQKAWEEYGRDAEDTYLKAGDEKPTGKCRTGDRKLAEKFECSSLVLDENGKIEVETAENLTDSSQTAEELAEVLRKTGKTVGKLGKGVYKIPAKIIGKLIETAGEAAGVVSKIPDRLLVVKVTVPAIRITNVCRRGYLCTGGRWTEYLDYIDSSEKEEPQVFGGWDKPLGIKGNEVKKFLEAELKNRLKNRKDVIGNCKECQTVENTGYGE